ncbi:MAG: DUF58 domain-containing protein [Zavarzinella sp.]
MHRGWFQAMAPKEQEEARRFFDPKVISRISRLDLRARQVVEGFISGMHRSPFFGHSVEFAQHREYVRGDDIRHLDWKVWSKTDRFYIKQYEAETNLRCNVIVDVSESMHYGRGAMNKYEYACTIGASIAYMAVKQQDTVGMFAFDQDVRANLPAKSSQLHLDAIVQTLHVSKPRDKTDILKILRRITESVGPRGLIVLISDCFVDREPLLKGLEMLRSRRHDVMVFHVLDEEEVTFPFSGMTKFEGMEEMPDLLCDPKALRDGYLEALEEYLVEVRRGCSRLGVDYSLVNTSDYLDAIMSRFLHRRIASRAQQGKQTYG